MGIWRIIFPLRSRNLYYHSWWIKEEEEEEEEEEDTQVGGNDDENIIFHIREGFCIPKQNSQREVNNGNLTKSVDSSFFARSD